MFQKGTDKRREIRYNNKKEGIKNDRKEFKRSKKKKKLSQEEVAEKVYTSRSNISKYENGQLEPNLQTLKRMCELYRVSADEILGIKKPEEKEIEIINKRK